MVLLCVDMKVHKEVGRLNMWLIYTIRNRCLEIFLMFGRFLRDYFSGCLLFHYIIREIGKNIFLMLLLSAVIP